MQVHCAAHIWSMWFVTYSMLVSNQSMNRVSVNKKGVDLMHHGCNLFPDLETYAGRIRYLHFQAFNHR